MDTDHTLSLTDARKQIFSLADDVATTQSHYVLTENGRPKAVLLSAELFDSWRETIDVLAETPDIENELIDARREYDRGNYATLDHFLASRGLVLSEAKKTYGSKKRRKK
jgi:prevent-host-death family protein